MPRSAADWQSGVANLDNLESPAEYFAYTPSADAIPGGEILQIYTPDGGTVNLTQPNGVQRDGVPLLPGYNAIKATHVRPGGTATGLWLYR